MRLSDDALLLWHDLWEDGVELLEGDIDALLDRFSDAEDERWPRERLEAAVAELRDASILTPDREVAHPAIEAGSSRVIEDGLLARVSVTVSAPTSLRTAGLRRDPQYHPDNCM